MMPETLPEPATVYGLMSNRDNRVRYVGQTQGVPQWALDAHLASARKGKAGRLNDWMRDELAAGHRLDVVAITDAGVWNETVHALIAEMLAAGIDLLAVPRRVGKASETASVGQEAREKMAALAKGRRHSERTKAKISAASSATAARKKRASCVDPVLFENRAVGIVRANVRGLTHPRH